MANKCVLCDSFKKELEKAGESIDELTKENEDLKKRIFLLLLELTDDSMK